MSARFDPDRRTTGDGMGKVDFASAGVPADRVLIILLMALVAHALCVLLIGLWQPITDKHAFRQTQTALTAYWLWKGGSWFAYEIPVLGYPWAIPFEFPIYQYLVALLRLVGIPIDVGGRLISFAFYLGCLWPLGMLFQALRFGRAAYLAVGILFLSSPLYLFWGRTVMIESCALFFGLLWLALLADFLSRARLPILLLTVLAGTAAILAKATTFPAFLLLGGLLFLHYARRDGLSLPNRRMLLLAVLAFAIPLLLGYAWVVYSDAVKQHNPFGALLTSGNLAFWSFGDWSQRASRELWLGTILLRTLRNAFGYGFPLAIVLTSIALVSRRWTLPAIAAVLAYLVPFLIFTNLHLQHDYYQNANALFALAAAAFGIARIATAGYRWTVALLVIVLAASQLAFFWREEAPFLTADLRRSPQLAIALMARQRTPPESGLVVIGDDWSSTIPYYAERKAVSVPAWTPRPLLERLLADPAVFLGGLPLGGIVHCPLSATPSDIAPQLQAFVAGRRLLGTAYGCHLLAAGR